MDNTYTGCSVFDNTNTTNSGFVILTGVDMYYMSRLPKIDELGIPEEKQ